LESKLIIKLDLENEAKRPVPEYLEMKKPPYQMTEMLRYSGVPLDEAKRLISGLSVTEEESGLHLSGSIYREDSSLTPEEELLLKNLEKAISLINGKCNFRAGYVSGKLNRDEDGFPILPFSQKSENLKKNLNHCDGYVMFTATIGAEIDRLIRRYEISDSTMGMFLQGVGAERVESLCNYFNDEVKRAAAGIGYKAHPRFSPGYGDLPITVQKEFLEVLDAGRRLGITLSESYLMAPSKSVTAVIGLERI